MDDSFARDRDISTLTQIIAGQEAFREKLMDQHQCEVGAAYRAYLASFAKPSSPIGLPSRGQTRLAWFKHWLGW